MNKLLNLSSFNFSSLWLLALSAVVGGLAFAPFNQPIALFFANYVLLSYLQKQADFKNFFKITAIFCFLFFLTQLYWIAWAVNVYGIPLAMPLVVLVMPVIIGVFPLILVLPSYYFKENKIIFAWVFGLGWFLSELARSLLFTGFPWNLSGYVWDLALLQSTRFFGIYGLSLLTIASAVVLFTKQRRLGIVIFGLLLCLWWNGNHRLKSPKVNTDINLRLVQPSIDQRQKWSPDCFHNNLERLLLLSTIESEKPITLTIWPEAAVTVPLDGCKDLSAYLGSILSPGGYLLTGAPRLTHAPELVFSSLHAIDHHGVICATFDKFHLVPFGEYVPLKALNPFPKLTQGTLDYSPGKGPQTISLPKISPFSPLICYEGIFSGEVIDAANRPHWLLNITNDAWYGNTSGPYQHLKIVQVRAIEEGVPLVRVANNGISAVIDAYGRIMAQLELDKVGFIDESLPVHLPPTMYRKLLNFLT